MAVCGTCWRSAQSSPRCGPPEGLPPSAPLLAVQVVEGSIPEPSKGQVRVRLQLRPVNPADIFSVQGARRVAASYCCHGCASPASWASLPVWPDLPVKPAGVYPGFASEEGSSLPAVPGLEGMGVVDKCGAGASQFKAGASGLSSEQRHSQPASTSSSVSRHTLHKLKPACTSLVQASALLVHRLTPQRGAAHGSSTLLSTRVSCWRCQTKYLMRRPRNSW